MAKKESATERMAREGGENEAQAGREYHRQMQKPAKPAKRAVGRKLKK
jgi:hypothetical protein